jgi:hypothetical protein
VRTRVSTHWGCPGNRNTSTSVGVPGSRTNVEVKRFLRRPSILEIRHRGDPKRRVSLGQGALLGSMTRAAGRVGGHTGLFGGSQPTTQHAADQVDVEVQRHPVVLDVHLSDR